MVKTLKILGLWLELKRKMDFHTKKRGRSYKEKRLRSVRIKGMGHRKRAWRSAMLKGPRVNTIRVHTRADIGACEDQYGFMPAGCYGFGNTSSISPGN